MLSRLMTIREQLLLLGVAAAILTGAGVLIWRGSGHAAPPPDTFAARKETTPPSATPPKPPVPAPMLAAASAEVTATPAAATVTPSTAPPPPQRIGVGILGAVENEGLYYFDQGARVRDLLQAAGGEREDADLSDINRTALLIDQTTLLVPRLISQGGEYYSDPPVTYNPAPYTRSTWYQFNKKTEAAQTGVAGGTGAAATGTSGGLIDINTATQTELETLPGIGPATAQKIIAHRQSAPFQTIEDLEKVSGIGPAKMSAVRTMITVK
jgi:competence protein ComEA